MAVPGLGRNLPRSTGRGFTLTEIAIVLGIIGLIVGAIWAASARVHRNQNIEKTVNQIINIATGMKATYSNGFFKPGGQNISAFVINSQIADANGPCTSKWTTGAGGNAGCSIDALGHTFLFGTQTGWDGLPANINAYEIIIDWSAQPVSCQAFLGALVPQAVQAGLVEIYDGTSVYPVSAGAVASDFAGCSPNGDIGLQFQL